MCEPAASDVDQEPGPWWVLHTGRYDESRHGPSYARPGPPIGESILLAAVVFAASVRPLWAVGGIVLGLGLLCAWEAAHDKGDCPAYWSGDVSTFEPDAEDNPG